MQELPRTWKIATAWLLIGLAVFLGFQYLEREQLRTRVLIEAGAQGDRVVVLRRAPDGHYHWPGRFEGRDIDFLVDTGATRTAVPQSLAQAAGLPALGTVQSSTAGGIVQGTVHRATLELDGGLRIEALPVIALPRLGDRPLLGMDVLGRLRLEQQAGELRITLPAP